MSDITVINGEIHANREAFLAAWGDTPMLEIGDYAKDADPARSYFLGAVGDGLMMLG